MIVISDSTPLHYLILIDEIQVLGELFGQVVIPQAVFDELQHENTRPGVKSWIADAPPWLQVRHTSATADPQLAVLGAGEREAIVLAQELRADLLLMDDRAGRHEAERRNLKVIGSLAVLEEGAKRGLVNLPEALAKLQETSFRVSKEVLESLLERNRG
jgi:predicted nucleic acid-binding protein